MRNTSSKANKIIVIYNLHFFNEILCEMYKTGKETIIDSANTLWHIEDVQKVLSSWKVA